MAETRKLAAILAADVVGYSRLAGSDEERTLARLRGLRSDLIDPTISLHHGRVVKRTGDGLPRVRMLRCPRGCCVLPWQAIPSGWIGYNFIIGYSVPVTVAMRRSDTMAISSV